MSEKKREPLLSEDVICGLDLANSLYGEERVALEVGMRMGRSFYERLIDEGRLRVAKEVEAMPTRVGVTLSAECSECGASPIRHVFTFCPGCGGKIKR